LGIVSIVGIFLNIKKHAKATLVSYIVLVIGIGAVYLGTQVGNSGGNIRHTEIREDSASNNHKKKMQYQPMFLNKMIKVILTTLY
jgi:hypothetical protein